MSAGSRQTVTVTGAPLAARDAAPGASGLVSGTEGHRVLFYDADAYLLEGVAEFLAVALRRRQRAIMVATPDHRAGVIERLALAGIDLAAARADGRLVEADAAATLARFMVGRAPSPERFARTIADLLGGQIGPPAHVFGEMVALLVAAGNPRGALELEALWNQAQTNYAFALLCGYRMQDLGEHGLSSVFEDVCGEHSSVVPTETYAGLERADDRLREIARLQQQAASLERALIAERAARDQAEAALRTRDEFLSVASHELRTPITLLGAQAQLLLRRLAREGQLDSARVEHALRVMGGQADKLGRLVGQLLDVSRLDWGKFDIERRPVDLVALVSELVASMRQLASDQHTLSLATPATLTCELDPVRIEQVICNLVDNALKYSPAGGAVEVVVEQPSAGCVRISVRDHGLGIAPEARGRIFDRFFQAHASAYRSGMGLGLYVSREIVELHGGTLRAEFPADGGTCMIVELPTA